MVFLTLWWFFGRIGRETGKNIRKIGELTLLLSTGRNGKPDIILVLICLCKIVTPWDGQNMAALPKMEYFLIPRGCITVQTVFWLWTFLVGLHLRSTSQLQQTASGAFGAPGKRLCSWFKKNNLTDKTWEGIKKFMIVPSLLFFFVCILRREK